MIHSNDHCGKCGGQWLHKPGGLEPRECPWCEVRRLKEVIAALIDYIDELHARDNYCLPDGALPCPGCNSVSGSHPGNCKYLEAFQVAEQIAEAVRKESE